MTEVDRLLAQNLLDGAAARAFEDSRSRVAQRHAHWRANFPAIGALLDSDVERAQALAGNHATEARETVGVWLSAQEAEPPAEAPVEADLDEQARWVSDFWEAWRARVFADDDVAALEGPARERFIQVFDDLMTRFRDEAMEFVRHGGALQATEPAWTERVAAPFRALARGIESFFFPSVRR
jgi:hypothetical protein